MSWLWLLLFFAVITMGELYFSPIGLALTARVAPAQILSMMMGVWLMTSFTGNLLQGYIGSYFSRMDKRTFFLLCAGVGVVRGGGVLAVQLPAQGDLWNRGPTGMPHRAASRPSHQRRAHSSRCAAQRLSESRRATDKAAAIDMQVTAVTRRTRQARNHRRFRRADERGAFRHGQHAGLSHLDDPASQPRLAEGRRTTAS